MSSLLACLTPHRLGRLLRFFTAKPHIIAPPQTDVNSLRSSKDGTGRQTVAAQLQKIRQPGLRDALFGQDVGHHGHLSGVGADEVQRFGKSIGLARQVLAGGRRPPRTTLPSQGKANSTRPSRALGRRGAWSPGMKARSTQVHTPTRADHAPWRVAGVCRGPQAVHPHDGDVDHTARAHSWCARGKATAHIRLKTRAIGPHLHHPTGAWLSTSPPAASAVRAGGPIAESAQGAVITQPSRANARPPAPSVHAGPRADQPPRPARTPGPPARAWSVHPHRARHRPPVRPGTRLPAPWFR